jgi:hypothetical protein
VLGLTADAFRDRLRDQRRGNWDERLHAPAIAAWAERRAGSTP